jgi:hypothetical protein
MVRFPRLHGHMTTSQTSSTPYHYLSLPSHARAKTEKTGSLFQGSTLCSSVRLSRCSSISARRSRALRHYSLLPVSLVFSSHGLVSLMPILSSRETILTGPFFPPPFPRQHVLTDMVRTVYAFKKDQVPLGPDLYYANVASALSLVKTALYLVITVIFDSFIVSVVSNAFFGANLTPPLASPMLHGLGPQLPRDSAAVRGLAC